MDMVTGLFDSPSAKVLAILGALSSISMLLRAFGNPENSMIKMVSKIVDFFSANVKH
jgi:hypothetical protein